MIESITLASGDAEISADAISAVGKAPRYQTCEFKRAENAQKTGLRL